MSNSTFDSKDDRCFDAHRLSSPETISGDDFELINVETNAELGASFLQDLLKPRCFDIASTGRTQDAVNDSYKEQMISFQSPGLI